MIRSARRLGVVFAAVFLLAFGLAARPASAHGWYGCHHHDHGWYGHSYHHGHYYDDWDYDDHVVAHHYHHRWHDYDYDYHHHYWWGGHHHHHGGYGCW